MPSAGDAVAQKLLHLTGIGPATAAVLVAKIVDKDFKGEGNNNPNKAEIYYELRNGKLKVAYPVFVDGTSLAALYAAKGEDFPPTIDLVARGVLKLKPLVTHVVPLLDLEKAMGMLESDEDQRMKIIMENPR